MNKILESGAKYLAGIGALNWGTSQFIGIDALSYVPTGIIQTLAVAAIAVSGGAIIYWAWKKRI